MTWVHTKHTTHAIRHFQSPRLEIEIRTFFRLKCSLYFWWFEMTWAHTIYTCVLTYDMRVAVQNISHVVTKLEYVLACLVYHLPKYYMSEIFSAVEIVTWTWYEGIWRALEFTVCIVPCLTNFCVYSLCCSAMGHDFLSGLNVSLWCGWKMKTDRKLVWTGGGERN